MHRKSLEAAEHLKEDGCNSDREETNSLRTDTSDASITSGQQSASVGPQPPGVSPHPPNHPPEKDRSQAQQPQQQPSGHPFPGEDPEAFRNNSIACLRAKAQEHSAKLLNHGLMLQVRSLTSMAHAQPAPCDANANNLHHGELVNSDSTGSSMFWQRAPDMDAGATSIPHDRWANRLLHGRSVESTSSNANPNIVESGLPIYYDLETLKLYKAYGPRIGNETLPGKECT